MASVPAPASFASSKETTNYARLCRLLVDVGTQALRDTFDTIHPPATLPKVLSLAHPTLLFLKKKVLNPTQWGKLYPTHPSSVSSASFDITLLMVLLRNICSLTPPSSTGSWDKLPLPGDNSREANIARIKYYRNQVYAHASQASVDDATFNMLWQDISYALLGLGSGATYFSVIICLKTECMDPVVEEHYQKLLKEWKIDDESTKEKLESLEEMLQQWKSNEDSTKDMIGEVQEMSKYLMAKLSEIEDILKKRETDKGSGKDTLKETHANNSTTERLSDSAQDNNALSSISENRDEQPGREGAEGGHERKSSRSGSIHEVILRKMSLTKDPTHKPLPNEDPDRPQDGAEVPEEKSSSLILHPLKVQDFDFYDCEVRSCDAGQHNSCCITSNVAALDVAPSAGRAQLSLENFEKDHVELFDWMCSRLDNGRRSWFGKDYERLAAKFERISLGERNLLHVGLTRNESPSKLLMNLLQVKYPELTVADFLKKIKEIGRNDIAKKLSPLVKHFA